jgi:hypothetical protein
MHCSKFYAYSITSSAATSRPGGPVRPSAFAVQLLMTNSNWVVSRSGHSLARAMALADESSG